MATASDEAPSSAPASVTLVTTPCPVCGSSDRVVVYPGTIPPEKLDAFAGYSYDVLLDGHHPIVRCSGCGLHYACPRDSGETLAQVYASGNATSYLKEAEGKLISFRREARFLRRLCGAGGDLLEIGCAAGLFLRAASEEGFRVRGCDPWGEAAAVAKETFGDQVAARPFDPADYETSRFRVVALWDVIEHVEEPAKLLGDIARLVAPGGWVALSTPNFGSLSRRLLGGRWHFLERPHLALFDPKTIAAPLAAAGFTDIRTHGQWKTYSMNYLAGYTAKWSRRVSQALLAVAPREWPRLSLPTGCMRVYARKV